MAGLFDKFKANWANQPSGTKMQSALGAGQLLFGSLMGLGDQRPKMPIPGAVQEATSLARMQAGATTRPGNEYAISQINRNQGQSINALNRSLGSSSQILAGLGQVNQNTNRALAENANQNTLFKFNATQNLQNSLARLGQYQNQQFRTNELDPYLGRQQTKNMLVGAGIQNLSGAANTRDEMAMYEKVFGSEQPAGNKFFGVNAGALDKPLFKLPQGRNSFMKKGSSPSFDMSQFDENFNLRPQLRF